MKTAPEHIQELIDAGATITITNAAAPTEPITLPLAVCEFVGVGRLFYCPPMPYDQHDLHEFRFSELEQYDLGVMFRDAAGSRAYITTIDEAGLEDDAAEATRAQCDTWRRFIKTDTPSAQRYRGFLENELRIRKSE